MATNMTRDDIYRVPVVCSDPATPTSGSPVRYGLLTGVALVDESAGGNASGETSVDFGPREWSLSVKGVNDSGNSAVAKGEAIFYTDGDTPKLNKKSSGYFFGIASEAITSGATATIRVMHVPSPGAGTLGSGTVGATNLATDSVTTVKILDDNVTAGKLTDTLATGYINLPLGGWRLIAANDIAAKNAADGGLISLDTDPTLKRVNAATDKQLRIAWAATSVIEITTQFAYPPDLDDTAAVTVNLLMGMAGAADTPLIGVSYWEGVGDTNAGGNTTALAAAVAQKTVAIAAGDVGAYPKVATVGIIPAAHATDAIYLYAAWITYARK
jgi:hypothetical protein